MAPEARCLSDIVKAGSPAGRLLAAAFEMDHACATPVADGSYPCNSHVVVHVVRMRGECA